MAAGQCAAILTAATKYYTPQGEDVDIVTAVTAASGIPDSEWRPQSTALAAGGLGTLVQLLFGVMGLLIPAGALGYLGSVGADLVSNKLGGGIATSILVVVVGVVVVGAILPQIIDTTGYLLRRYGRQPLLHLLRRSGKDCGNHQQLLRNCPDSGSHRHRHDDMEGTRLRR